MMRRIPPPLLLCALAATVQRFLNQSRKPTRTTNAMATAIAAGSAATLVSPVLAFHRAGTTVDPREDAQSETLVTNGLNSVSRNPMYLGMAGLLIAHAIYRRSPNAVAPAVVFAVWIDRVQIPGEERHLKESFGDVYDDYQNRVARWLRCKRRDKRADVVP